MTLLLPTGQGNHGFAIVSKDTDFNQRSVALGSPRKFVWLRVGNCGTDVIIDLLRSRHALIRDFIVSETESVLVLRRLPQEP
jgi:predicted nuclease of predicted toxin-antitoxin system